MKTSKALLPLAVLLLLLYPAFQVVSKPSDAIVISGADVSWESIPAANPDLSIKLDGAGLRVIFQFANESLQKLLITAPPPFQTLLDAVSAHVVIGYANTSFQKNLVSAPIDFQTRLDQVADRVVFAYANANREYALSYPMALVSDDTPPQITNIAATGSGIISWTTDEFATSTVRYGTQSGVYLDTVTDPLYTKLHEVNLTGLVIGTKYYYRVRSTDQSDNTATSMEKSFVPQPPVYLPLVLQL